jgi:hypothetical protein
MSENTAPDRPDDESNLSAEEYGSLTVEDNLDGTVDPPKSPTPATIPTRTSRTLLPVPTRTEAGASLARRMSSPSRPRVRFAHPRKSALTGSVRTVLRLARRGRD